MNQIFNFSKTVSASASGDAGREEFDLLLKVHQNLEEIISCPYCKNNVVRWDGYYGEDISDWEYRDYDFQENIYSLLLCATCGWFRYRSVDTSNMTMPFAMHEIALLEKMNGIEDSVPIREIKRYLKYNWKDHVFLSPGKAEQLVADIFKEHLDCEIHYTTNGVYSPDGGIDFVLVNTINGIEYAFQVKRRLTDSPERVTEVRSFLGAMSLSPFSHGYYVTTANKFTKSTTKEIESSTQNLSRHKIAIELIDGSRLLTILKNQKTLPSSIDYFHNNHFDAIKDWIPLNVGEKGLINEKIKRGETFSFKQLIDKTFHNSE